MSNEQFFDAFESIEQLNLYSESSFESSSVFTQSEFASDQPTNSPKAATAEYKSGNSSTYHKTELFSWTTKNITRKKRKDIKEFSGLEILQDFALDSSSSRNWVLKFSPNCEHLALAGEKTSIYLFRVNQCFTEKSSEFLSLPEVYTGHSQSIISVEWKPDSEFFVSFGVDCLVLLWRVGLTIPIRQFLEKSIVTCAGFNPLNPNTFFTGSLSKILSIWSLTEEQVVNTYQLQGMITAGAYSPNGLLLSVGLANGQCIIYESNNVVLTFLTQLHCTNHKGAKSGGKKVTGIEFQDDLYILITTNDSRLRLFSLVDFSLLQKYTGGKCEQYPIKGTFSQNFGHVIRGSEDGLVMIWNTLNCKVRRLWGLVRDSTKNDSYEYFSVEKGKGVSHAVFAPVELLKKVQQGYIDVGSDIIIGHIIVCSACGRLKVLFNQFKNVPW